MDIGMLLDMDNFSGTISTAVHSSGSISSLASNNNLVSRTQDITRTPRAHLHPMTNMSEAHEWDKQSHIQGLKQWPQYQQYQCSSPQRLKTLPTSNALCITPGQQYQDRTACPTTSSSFLTHAGSHDIKTAPYSSPAESPEDLQWQMYLTASLSNPLNSLEFAEPHSSPLLLYPSGTRGDRGIDPSFPMEPTLFPSTNSSTFLSSQAQHDIFDTIPFIGSPSRISTGFSSNQTPRTYDEELLSPHHQVTPSRDRNAPIIDEDGSYASLLGFTPLADLTFASALLRSPSVSHNGVGSSPAHSSPAHGRSQIRAPQSPNLKSQRGLYGWENVERLNAPSSIPSLSDIQRKRPRSRSASPSAVIRRTCAHSPLSLSANSDPTSATHQYKRRRQLAPPSARFSEAEEIETEDDIDNPAEDNESDDYRPSRSPSPDPAFGTDFPLEFERQGSRQRQSKSVVASATKKKSRRGKGKAKGSAALALAVVTQLGTKGLRGGSSEQQNLDTEEFDAMTLYQEGKTGIRKRKNNPIPLPVPVPNLNKKSRGRKVPFVADLSADGPRRSMSVLSTDNFDDNNDSRAISSGSMGRTRSLRKSTTPAPVIDEGGCRTYVCVIPGCGKCFVRGEHLKRHVRSIHTHDKQHHCPYEGCDKSFSRRDNLGQHVRIHLQP